MAIHMVRDEEIPEFVIDDLLDTFYDPESYDPDSFYEDCIEGLREWGYERETEQINEFGVDRGENTEVDHLEYIAALGTKGYIGAADIYLRFVVEDVRPGYKVPQISQVSSEKDFDLKPRK